MSLRNVIHQTIHIGQLLFTPLFDLHRFSPVVPRLSDFLLRLRLNVGDELFARPVGVVADFLFQLESRALCARALRDWLP